MPTAEHACDRHPRSRRDRAVRALGCGMVGYRREVPHPAPDRPGAHDLPARSVAAALRPTVRRPQAACQAARRPLHPRHRLRRRPGLRAPRPPGRRRDRHRPGAGEHRGRPPPRRGPGAHRLLPRGARGGAGRARAAPSTPSPAWRSWSTSPTWASSSRPAPACCGRAG